MKLRLKTVVLFSLVIFSLSTLSACEKEGGAEKAGKKIDKTFNTAKDKIDEATK